MSDVEIIIGTNASSVRKEFDSLGLSVLNQVKKVEQLEKQYSVLDRALNKGTIDAQKYSLGVQQIDRAIEEVLNSENRLAKAVNNTGNAMTNGAARAAAYNNSLAMSGKSTNRFGLISQQVGYQVGDFFVQVQSGANAIMAFGQQSTQLAGLLPGLSGAILGIGLSIGTALLGASMRAKELTLDFKAIGNDFSSAIEPISPLLKGIQSVMSAVGQTFSVVGRTLIDNLDRIVVYGLTLAGVFGVKLVASFILSGRAATVFFRLFKAGLISTGVGIFVVALGEIALRFTRLVKNAGSFGEALGMLKNVASDFWGFLTAKADVFGAKLESIGPRFESFMLGILNSLLNKVEVGINYMISGINEIFSKLNIDPIPEVNITGSGSGINAALTAAQTRLAQREANIAEAETIASGAYDKLITGVRDLLGFTNSNTDTVDTSDWFMPDDDSSPSSRERKTFTDLLNAYEKETEQQKALAGVYGDKRTILEEVFSMEDELGRKLTENEVLKVANAVKEQERIRQHGEILDSVNQTIKSGLMDLVKGTQTVTEAFKNMLYDILTSIYEQNIVTPMAENFSSILGGLIFKANGGAFNNGVEMFANGGTFTNSVVSKPTAFSHAGGLGVMGEAGPEAIMPLKRMANGKLGVEANSDGGSSNSSIVVHQSFNFSANGDDSVKRIIAQAAPQIAQMTQKQIMESRRRGGQMKATFS